MSVDLWEQCLRALQQEFPSQQFNTWIRPLRAQDSAGTELLLLAPNRFVKDWVADKFLARIQQAVCEATGDMSIEVRLDVAGQVGAAMPRTRTAPGRMRSPRPAPEPMTPISSPAPVSAPASRPAPIYEPVTEPEPAPAAPPTRIEPAVSEPLVEPVVEPTPQMGFFDQLEQPEAAGSIHTMGGGRRVEVETEKEKTTKSGPSKRKTENIN
eukprot:Anaeramoba_flamelloidesc36619_g1_i3.p1 GENE.c36619_g1_i3~~c36619_g1_i3.p1  ORF type:complete len:211 (-),score=7.59 c36619_g1_i3:8-640(-)